MMAIGREILTVYSMIGTHLTIQYKTTIQLNNNKLTLSGQASPERYVNAKAVGTITGKFAILETSCQLLSVIGLTLKEVFSFNNIEMPHSDNKSHAADNISMNNNTLMSLTSVHPK